MAGGGGLVSAEPIAGGGAVASGTISIVAGGVGGPGKATQVALGSFFADMWGVSYNSGHLYVADGFTVRDVNVKSSWLRTSAGTGGDAGGPLGDGGQDWPRHHDHG